jgi:hypothetical protein
MELNFAGEASEGTGSVERAGDGAARVVEAWMEDEHGVKQGALPQGRPCTFKAAVRFDEPLEDPSFAVAFVNAEHQNVFVATSATEFERTGRFTAGETVTFSVSFENALGPGRYRLSTLIARPGGGNAIVDRWENILSVVVTGARPAGGLVDLAHDLAIERTAQPSAADRAG